MTRQLPRWCQTRFAGVKPDLLPAYYMLEAGPFSNCADEAEALHPYGDRLCLTQLPGPFRGLGLEERRRTVLAGGLCAVTLADAWKWVAWS